MGGVDLEHQQRVGKCVTVMAAGDGRGGGWSRGASWGAEGSPSGGTAYCLSVHAAHTAALRGLVKQQPAGSSAGREGGGGRVGGGRQRGQLSRAAGARPGGTGKGEATHMHATPHMHTPRTCVHPACTTPQNGHAYQCTHLSWGMISRNVGRSAGSPDWQRCISWQ